MNRAKMLGCVVLSVAMLSSVAVGGDEVRMDGSTTVGPIADAFAEYFEKTRDVKITVNKTGSGDGAAALIADRCDIANMSRPMKMKEFEKAVANGVMPVAHVVAMDGVCVAVHPKNPIKALTTEKIKAIYQGKITNWKELGGPDMKIVPISRDTNSGTYETFHKLVMNKDAMAEGIAHVNSQPHMQKRIQDTQAAIGYVGLGFLEGVKALKVNGIEPTRQTVATGVYPIARPLFMWTNGYPTLGSLVHQMVTFHLTVRGQDIIEAKGYVPVTNY